MIYSKEELQMFADVVVSQILASITQSEFLSWGISKMGYASINERPGLVIHVSALLHTGVVIVTLDEGKDLYEVTLATKEGNVLTAKEVKTDIHCEELGRVIDQMIERPAGMSDEEYHSRAMEDSIFKMVSD